MDYRTPCIGQGDTFIDSQHLSDLNGLDPCVEPEDVNWPIAALGLTTIILVFVRVLVFGT